MEQSISERGIYLDFRKHQDPNIFADNINEHFRLILQPRAID